ncbi:hypothetical protein HanRHA438_Chr14g0629971 [Helianthus annuus]|nr:hypothetical protein HanRHA438_Chr14g0629971 [Helianthus annuus]
MFIFKLPIPDLNSLSLSLSLSLYKILLINFRDIKNSLSLSLSLCNHHSIHQASDPYNQLFHKKRTPKINFL